MSRHRIIGIHGLNNKPARERLAEWWRASIAEGLARNSGRRDAQFDFELVYWADALYPSVLDPDPEPYLPAAGEGPLARHDPSRRDGVREALQGALDKMTAIPKVDVVTEQVISRRTPDLHRYYAEEDVRRRLRAGLADAILRAGAEGRRIMVVGHSMGSIIAFDVLSGLAGKRGARPVEHLVTVGSPLGLHEVKQQAREQGLESRVPEIVEHWTNLADRRDRIAFDSRLATDYAESSRGVGVADALVINGYVRPDGTANPHKIYGYLRTPEASELFARFAGT